MAELNLTLRMRKRWFFWPALIFVVLAGALGLIRDKASDEHVDGVETGQERAARWLADHAIVVEIAG